MQTEGSRVDSDVESSSPEDDTTLKVPRTVEECVRIYKSELGASALTDEEVIVLVKNKHIPSYQVEKAVDNPERGVGIRRKIIGANGNLSQALLDLPYKNYDYSKVRPIITFFFECLNANQVILRLWVLAVKT